MNKRTLIEVQVRSIVLSAVEAVVGILEAVEGRRGVDGPIIPSSDRRRRPENELLCATISVDVDFKDRWSRCVNATDAEMELTAFCEHDTSAVRDNPRFNGEFTAESVGNRTGDSSALG